MGAQVEITRMARAKRSNARVLLELDGEAWTECGDGIVAEFLLYQGKQLTAHERGRIEARIVETDALAWCHASIARRALTRSELGTKLAERGYDAALVEATLERCEQLGLIDDARYARTFVRSRTGRGHGPRRIVQDLARRGVSRDLAQVALDEHADDEDTPDAVVRCTALLEKRYRDPAAFADRAVQAKAQRFLLGRGFGSADVTAAVRSFGATDG